MHKMDAWKRGLPEGFVVGIVDIAIVHFSKKYEPLCQVRQDNTMQSQESLLSNAKSKPQRMEPTVVLIRHPVGFRV